MKETSPKEVTISTQFAKIIAFSFHHLSSPLEASITSVESDFACTLVQLILLASSSPCLIAIALAIEGVVTCGMNTHAAAMK
jgi:hypothetical protein